jgi:hypothetical protein
VYGNILIMDADSNGIEHFNYGGDMSDPPYYRIGPLEAYNNTCISHLTANTRLVRLTSSTQIANLVNNIWYVPNGTAYVLSYSIGQCTTSHNWFQSGYSLTGAVSDGTDISGTDPGFVNYAGGNYNLAGGSACIAAGGALASEVLPAYNVLEEYVVNQGHGARPYNGQLDIGAYAYNTGTLTVESTSMAAGYEGSLYWQNLAGYGGAAPYTWSIPSGSLPAGLSLDNYAGSISGTPTAGGTSSFTVCVTDSTTPAAVTATQALSIVINVPTPLVITTTSLPDGTSMVGYLQVLTATGGTPPYTWSITGGSLPAGLSLGSSTGTISGTPTATGTSGLAAKATGSQATTAVKALGASPQLGKR